MMGRLAILLLTFFLLLGPSVHATPEAKQVVAWLPYAGVESPPLPAWLERVNEYRRQAGLSRVDYDPLWSRGDWLHARYIVKEDTITHTEDPQSPWYTPEGALAGEKSNVMATSRLRTRDTQAIDLWMSGPFHALGILDPHLTKVGFGSYRENVGLLHMAAALDVIRGIDWRVPFPADVIVWPGHKTTVPLRAFVVEWPDPLTSCPGYTAPAGLPIIAMTPGKHVERVRMHQGQEELEVCVFDANTYTNPDPQAQEVARSILRARWATVIVPRSPLEPGKVYTVTVRVDGKQKRWQFRVWEHAPLNPLD